MVRVGAFPDSFAKGFILAAGNPAVGTDFLMNETHKTTKQRRFLSRNPCFRSIGRIFSGAISKIEPLLGRSIVRKHQAHGSNFEIEPHQSLSLTCKRRVCGAICEIEPFLLLAMTRMRHVCGAISQIEPKMFRPQLWKWCVYGSISELEPRLLSTSSRISALQVIP